MATLSEFACKENDPVTEDKFTEDTMQILSTPTSTLRCYPGESDGPVVLMVHGLGSTGDIFARGARDGLAPWLAAEGYNVYVAELRDRVSIDSDKPDITQQQLLEEDFPQLFEAVFDTHPHQKLFLIGHGWGGVLLAATLIRHSAWVGRITGIVQLASRRLSQQRNWQQRLQFGFLWNQIGPVLGRYKGYIPLRGLGLGTADISLELHAESRDWQNSGIWRDPHNGFDYAEALSKIDWPPSLYLAGEKDRAWGHFEDVKAFARELGEHDAQLVLLEKGAGSSRSYGHYDLLTHPQAASDHFPLVLSWLARQGKTII